jgi:hypothetical protein
MGKRLPSLVAILVPTARIALIALFALPAVAPAAQVRSSGSSASAAALYPIPPAPTPTTPAAAAHAGAGAVAAHLATLSPAALAATGGATLSVTASGPGTFTFVLTARIHGRTVVIARGSRTAGAAGAITIKLTLTKAGKAALATAKGRLKVTVAATFKPKHGKAGTARSTASLK